MIREGPSWELKDPSPATEAFSIIDVVIALGSVLFVDSEVDPPGQYMDTVLMDKATSLLGYDRVLKYLLKVDDKCPMRQGNDSAEVK